MATQLASVFEQLLERALQLPLHQRIELAEALFESVDDEDPAALESAWAEEIKRRVEEVNSGDAELIPADVVFARARAHVDKVASARALAR
jgi:putative addiction module component (TIGR02574 family)